MKPRGGGTNQVHLSASKGIKGYNTMNQGNLEVVKQEMASVNIDILGISELKRSGMGKFNSDDHYIYYYGKNPLEDME